MTTQVTSTSRPAIYSFEGKTPVVAEDVFIAPGAIIVGDVEIGPGSSVWFNVVIRADCNAVRIGANTNIQDGAIIHVDPDAPCRIGDDCTIGHGAIVHGTTVGDRVLVGMGAVILSRSTIADEVLIAAGAVVPEEMIVRAGTLVAGVPAKEKRELDDSNRARLRLGADHYLEYGRRFRASLRPAGEG